VSRTLNAKLADLDNVLEFKSYFENRRCGGGSPRIQLAIDLNGDGIPDGNALGYTAPSFAAPLSLLPERAHFLWAIADCAFGVWRERAHWSANCEG